jgi:hypothetical protein
MQCNYFIVKKNRQCKNTAIKHLKKCQLHSKKKTMTKKQLGGSIIGDVPQSPFVITPSQLPPNPQQRSWYHHQAPIYQSFGDYVCIKREFLDNAKNLVNDIFKSK